ncbi:Runt protein [Danaus plexippus plexippus]|uniref:Runt protein n=1 Tax=Danaus plexippus plexippus TaxID=278856 RepID=A0A212FCF0_DANPL|nr:Runt protein [Danaus plexippus plexippus]
MFGFNPLAIFQTEKKNPFEQSNVAHWHVFKTKSYQSSNINCDAKAYFNEHSKIDIASRQECRGEISLELKLRRHHPRNAEFDGIDEFVTGIAHQLAGLPGGEWGALSRHYPPPLLPPHPHFTPHVLPAHSQHHSLPPPSHETDVTTDNPSTMHPHSTTSPINSRPSSPQDDDDISVTASISPPPDDRPGAFTSVTRTRKPLQPLPAPSSLFHSALAAQLFLNSPLLPTPPAWLYSQIYGNYDWWLRPPPPQEDSNSIPDQEEAGSTASSSAKKRAASPEWSESVRTRSKSLTTSERRPIDVWRPY